MHIGVDAGPGQPDRVKKALTVNKSSVAPLRGLRKDHKLNWDKIKGPPLRPLCNARLGPNAYLGNLQARFLRTVRVGLSKLVNTEVCSTEELCYHIGQYNKLVSKQISQSEFNPREEIKLYQYREGV